MYFWMAFPLLDIWSCQAAGKFDADRGRKLVMKLGGIWTVVDVV